MSNSSSRVAVTKQLINAVKAGNLETLATLLLQIDNDTGNFLVQDKDIEAALCRAARKGCVESCRLLWNKLSPNEKEKYYLASNNSSPFPPLHEATRNGHLNVVRLLVDEFHFNVHQFNSNHFTPLYYAAFSNSLEIIQFLLNHGANVNQGPTARQLQLQGNPLHQAICHYYSPNCASIVNLLLQHGADPNLHRTTSFGEGRGGGESYSRQRQPCNTDIVIMNGKPELLRVLLEYGALLGTGSHPQPGNALNDLLLQNTRQAHRETKLEICRILVNKAKTGNVNATEFLQTALDAALDSMGSNNNNDNSSQVDYCDVLFESGVDPIPCMYRAIEQGKEATCQLLLQRGVDPFLQQENNNNSNNNNGHAAAAAPCSPFHAAARLENTTILELFLGHWDDRFSSSTGGNRKNGNGDDPIHVLCRDKHVSLQAIKLVMERYDGASLLTTVDGEFGLFPCLLAATRDTSLDIIYYLLNQSPDALRQLRPSTITEDTITNNAKDHQIPAMDPNNANAALDLQPPPAAADTNVAADVGINNDQQEGPLQKKAKKSH